MNILTLLKKQDRFLEKAYQFIEKSLRLCYANDMQLQKLSENNQSIADFLSMFLKFQGQITQAIATNNFEDPYNGITEKLEDLDYNDIKDLFIYQNQNLIHKFNELLYEFKIIAIKPEMKPMASEDLDKVYSFLLNILYDNENLIEAHVHYQKLINTTTGTESSNSESSEYSDSEGEESSSDSDCYDEYLYGTVNDFFSTVSEELLPSSDTSNMESSSTDHSISQSSFFSFEDSICLAELKELLLALQTKVNTNITSRAQDSKQVLNSLTNVSITHKKQNRLYHLFKSSDSLHSSKKENKQAVKTPPLSFSV